MDLDVVRQGLHLLVSFGLRPLEEMTRVAELLEHSVYQRGSLSVEAGRVSFVLLNPPLRMGAFSRITLSWDGTPIPPERSSVVVGGSGPPRPLSDLSRERPLVLPVGERTRFWFEPPVVSEGTHAVRLDLQSVAIPPRVWFEFHDRLDGVPAP